MPHPLLIFFLLTYALLHSLLASQPCKARIQRACGATGTRWYRFVYNSIAVITLLPLLPLLATLPDRPLYSIAAPWNWLMFIGQGLAALWLVVALFETNLAHFLGLAQVRSPHNTADDSLTTSGSYAYVRHPLYVAGLLWMWLSPVMTVNLLTVYGLFSLYLYIGSFHEEHRLLQQFGPHYRAYQQRVGRFMPRIPWRHIRNTTYESETQL